MYKYKIVTTEASKHDILFTNDIDIVNSIVKGLKMQGIKASVFECTNNKYNKLIK